MFNKKLLLTVMGFLIFVCCSLHSAENLILNKVIIQGTETLSPDEISKYLNLPESLPYKPEMGSEISRKILTFLTQKGYYFADVKQVDIIPTGTAGVNLVFNIEEGYIGIVSVVRFWGNRYFSDNKIRQLLDLDTAGDISLKRFPDVLVRALNLYTSRGYLFAQVEIDSLLFEDSKLSAVIRIDEGPLFKSKNYLFSGNKITKASTLLKISGLNKKDLITPGVIAQAENNLLQREYIRDCRIYPLNESTVGIEVEEDRMTRIEGVFGLSDNPVSNKRDLSGFVHLQFLNLWGTDRAVSLYWKSQKSTYKLLELTYHESGLIDYPFAGDFLFQRTQQDSAWIGIKLQMNLYYQYSNHRFGTELYSETLYPDRPDSTGIQKTKYYGTSLTWEYDKTDYFANPTSGNQFRIKSGYLFTGSETTSKTTPVNEIDAISYYPIKRKLVWSTAIHYREISDKNAEIYEQYKMGGFKSLRGYGEDFFNGWRLGWINNELRYLLTRDSRIYLLFDYGFRQHQVSGADFTETDLFGLGAGISNKTRIGVISISYALAINDNRLTDWDSGMLHLGLASSF